MTLTGQQIYDVLAQQVTGSNALRRTARSCRSRRASPTSSAPRAPWPAACGSTASRSARPASYRIVTNNFLSDGGDGFPAFTAGTSKYFGGLDIDAFADYLAASSPYTPGPLTRITRVADFLARRSVRGVSDLGRTPVRTTVVSTGRGRHRFSTAAGATQRGCRWRLLTSGRTQVRQQARQTSATGARTREGRDMAAADEQPGQGARRSAGQHRQAVRQGLGDAPRRRDRARRSR